MTLSRKKKRKLHFLEANKWHHLHGKHHHGVQVDTFQKQTIDGGAQAEAVPPTPPCEITPV